MESLVFFNNDGVSGKKKNCTVKRIDQMCRVCFGDNELMNLFSSKVDEYPIGDVFYLCTSVKPIESELMPQNICMNCIEDLVKAYAFICKCKKADESLKSAVNLSTPRLGTVKPEVVVPKGCVIKEEYISLQNYDDEEITEISLAKTESNEEKGKIDKNSEKKENLHFNVDNIKVEYIDEDFEEHESEDDFNNFEADGSQYDENEDINQSEEHNEDVNQSEDQNDNEGSSPDSKERKFHCRTCKEDFQDFESLQNHRQTEHIRSKIECKICNGYFENRKVLYEHAGTHDEEFDSYLCNDCGKNFEGAVVLLEHIKNEHPTKNKSKTHYLCSQCGQVLKTKNGLSMHMLTHSKVKPNVCKICGASFSQKRNLVRHEMTHTGERPFVCEFCGKGFIQKVALQAHLNVHNSKSKRPPKCKFCLQVFESGLELKEHYKEFHNQNCKYGQKSQSASETDEKPKNYVCVYCSRKFASTATLRNHLLIHTGEKPHVCSTCGKRFRQLSHLSYHTLLHTGARNHVCTYCGKSFTLKGNLTVHIRTHTGETPYVCNVCGRGYYDSSNLRRHKETQHGILRKREPSTYEESQNEMDDSSNMESQHGFLRGQDYRSNEEGIMEIDESSNMESQQESQNYEEAEVEIEYETQEDLSY